MSRKVAEAVRQHLHDDFEVTELRLDAFAEAGRETQLQVMAELRLRSGDDWSTTELAFTAIALSAFGAIVVPTLELDPGAHTIVSVLIGLIFNTLLVGFWATMLTSLFVELRNWKDGLAPDNLAEVFS